METSSATIDKSVIHQLKVSLEQSTLAFTLQNYEVNRTFKWSIDDISLPDCIKLRYGNTIQFYKALICARPQLFQFRCSLGQVELRWSSQQLILNIEEATQAQIKPAELDCKSRIESESENKDQNIAKQQPCLVNRPQIQNFSSAKPKIKLSKLLLPRPMIEINQTHKSIHPKLELHLNNVASPQEQKQLKNQSYAQLPKQRVLRQRHKKVRSSNYQLNVKPQSSRRSNKDISSSVLHPTQDQTIHHQKRAISQYERLTAVVSQQKQQIKSLITEIAQIKQNFEGLRSLIMSQSIQIMDLKARNQTVGITQQQQQPFHMVNQNLVAKSEIQKEGPPQDAGQAHRHKHEWRINKHGRDYQDFLVENLKVTLINKNKGDNDKSRWSYIYLQNHIASHRVFSVTMQVHKCANQNIAIGITAQKNALKSHSWNEKDCIEYVGFSKLIFEGGRKNFESGCGIWEGLRITVLVNLRESVIEWRSQRGTQAKLTTDKLKNPKAKYVLFVRFKDIGDCIQFMGSPEC